MAYTDRQYTAFTQIAYMDLSKKYKKYCLENNTDKAPLNELLSKKEKSKLENLGISESEMNSWNISGIHDTNDENGFYACIIETSSGNAVVGYRGSEGMGSLGNVINDWVLADLGLLNSTCTNQHKEADEFLAKYQSQLDGYENLEMTGHSLGGNLAEYTTVVSSEYGLDDNIKQCVSLDGPGFSNEFISKYKDEINKMSGVMKHKRWSFVGTMLNDLPGVEYQYVKVSNTANHQDKHDYNMITRHDTKYLEYDENGNCIPGKQDNLSKITSRISRGFDKLPKVFGDAFITVVGGIWIGFTWAKENFFDKNGNISLTGWGIIGGIVGIIKIFGLPVLIKALVIVVVAVIAVIAIALVVEFVYELVMKAVDAICKAIAEICEWVEEVFNEIKDAVVALIDKAKEFFKDLFGFADSVTETPQITVDTYKLTTYADRITAVNSRVASLESRLDSLYWKVGLLGLWDLMQADFLTSYSIRLRGCANYLNETAEEFENVENDLINKVQ